MLFIYLFNETSILLHKSSKCDKCDNIRYIMSCLNHTFGQNQGCDIIKDKL
jgi:hypothetical protein